MLKMQVPVAYRPADSQAESPMLLQKMPTYLAEKAEQFNKAFKEDDWAARIKRWHQDQTVQETDNQKR